MLPRPPPIGSSACPCRQTQATKNPPQGRVSCSEQSSDGTAAVFAVGLPGWVGDHIGFDLLHLAATGEELFHGTGQSVALFLFGFDAGQLIDFNGFGLALLAAGYDLAVAFVTAVAVIGSSQLLTIVLVSPFQIVLFQVF